MSADVMEVDTGQFHYTEQLLRVDGQGIWYALDILACRITVVFAVNTLLFWYVRSKEPPHFPLRLCCAIGHPSFMDVGVM